MDADSSQSDEDAKYYEQKLIDKDMVFKAAMNSNFSKIHNLQLMQEGITRIDNSNLALKELGTNLRSFNLSYNRIRELENMECLSNMRELVITQNLISKINGLQKMSNLKTLNLSYNKIKRIEGLRHLRKLESLSLVGNRIKDLSQSDTDAMLELKELYLQGN